MRNNGPYNHPQVENPRGLPDVGPVGRMVCNSKWQLHFLFVISDDFVHALVHALVTGHGRCALALAEMLHLKKAARSLKT